MLLVLTVTTEQQQDRSTTLEQQQELVNNSRIAVRKNLVKTDAEWPKMRREITKFFACGAPWWLGWPLGPRPPHFFPFPQRNYIYVSYVTVI